ncbi:hypothetical protein J2X32_002966 [Rheinheimera pacifica]|uniref:hypothetical protein n=1 Tax=Rheinheimera pacifica TaxID=173990 RepID=UPI00285522DF|nr:hypothetical protein [Rheinheimera pacifica]MDR6984322.1 hypothetical protein [Rheinheimera pacifica]
MFEKFKRKIFLAKIQAELKAQYNDQDFVDTVCQHPKIIEKIKLIKEQAYYRNDKIAPFLTVCFILGEAAFTDDFPKDIREISLSLLAKRLIKVGGDPQFKLRHIMIFGDLEEKMRAHIDQMDLSHSKL